MTRRLRAYQAEAVQAVYDGWARTGNEPQGIVLPTGTGKTDIISRHAVDEAHAGGRTLVLAHRLELLEQIRDRIGMHDPAVSVGMVQGSTVQTRRRVICASIDTIRNDRRLRQVLRPSKVIVDECHHATAPGYLKVLDWAGVGDGTRAFGVTATMTRGGRPRKGERGLGDVWRHIAFERDIQWGVDEGWLVRPRGRVVVADHLDLSRVKARQGDYADNELGEMVAQDTEQIVAAWLEHAADRITAAFTPNIASAQGLRDAFDAAGVKAELVIGSTPHDQRRGIYARLAEGTTRVLVGVGVTTEGWDCPPVSCILMARPTKLPGLYQQIVGRGLRPHPGKDDCLVLDVVGASRVNGLATLVQLYRTAEQVDERAPQFDACNDCGLPVVPLKHRGEPYAPVLWCACERERLERDPDGGRRRLIGPATYADHDLFARPGLRWLVTRRRGRRFLPVGDRAALIWPEVDGTFTAGHFDLKSRPRAGGNPFDGQWLGPERTTLAHATAIAEGWART
jgi:superfamily II DNA or RNA helicase